MKLKEISNEIKQTSPVFIMGVKRSGTSMLYRTMQKHSLFTPKQIDLTETGIFRKATRAYQFDEEHPWDLINYMLKDQAHYKKFLTSIRLPQRLQKALDTKRILSRAANQRESSKRLWWYLVQSPYIIRSYFYYAQQARECQRLVEKTPHNVEFIPQIIHTFPKAKLICMFRHPVDVYSSRQRRGQMKDPNHGHLLMTIEDFCLNYRDSANQVLKQTEVQDQPILPVRYEAFTQNPAEEFHRICEFLAVPFEEDAIVEKKPDLSKWRPDPHLFGPIVPKTKDWQDFMTRDEARAIEHTLASTLSRLNYARYTSG